MGLIDKLTWRLRLLWAALRMAPIAGGDDGDDDKSKTDDQPPTEDPAKGDDDAKDDDETKDEEEDQEKDQENEPNWKQIARRNENRFKKEKREREKLAKQLGDQQKKQQTEQEQAIERAREEGRSEVQTKAERERRSDRLENSVIRTAARGVKVGESTIRFADPEDALLHLQRAIANGDVDEDDIFNDQGRVDGAAVTTALSEILESKPYLRAGDPNGTKDEQGKPRPQGKGDGGKGSEGSQKSLEDMSVEEHFQRIRKHKD